MHIGLIKQQQSFRAILKKRIWDFKNEVGKEKTAYIPVTDYFYEKLITWIAELKCDVTRYNDKVIWVLKLFDLL